MTPSGVTPAPSGKGPLVRVPTPPAPLEPARWRRFFLPQTADAATFRVGDRTIRVSGVAAPAADASCGLAEGGGWPCGATALHSLRMFLRGRPVECYFPAVDGVADVTAPCRVGETDLGQWLLGQGWATPDGLATPEYRAVAEDARCARRGIWRNEAPVSPCAATN
ncbi:MAG: thermonuclease family protein [Bauldia sp.]